jgi:4-hydroxy-tetrahydrodipicolinate reductase
MTMAALKVVVAGAGGRMGVANIRAVAAHVGLSLQAALANAPTMALHAAVDRPGTAAIGQDAGLFAGIEPLGVPITDDMDAALADADAIIDFTAPNASVALAHQAAARGLVHIMGTTGCSEADDAAIAEAGRNGARIVKSGNFSMGMTVLANLVEKAAAALADYDIEILEMHHNRKVDAPSGSALLLGEAAAKGRGIGLREHSVRVRDGHTGPREAGTIGFATLRGGNVIGDHMVILAGQSERIELNHRAQDRTIYANGAARAALWAAGQPAGLYSMVDVLGLND